MSGSEANEQLKRDLKSGFVIAFVTMVFGGVVFCLLFFVLFGRQSLGWAAGITAIAMTCVQYTLVIVTSRRELARRKESA